MNSIKKPLLVGVIVVLAAVFIVGKLDLYSYIPHLDKVFHVLCGGIAAWVFVAYQKGRGVRIQWVPAIAFVFVVGLLWECAEYLSSVYSPVYLPWFLKYFYGGGLVDSIGDLIADVLGGVLVILSSRRR